MLALKSERDDATFAHGAGLWDRRSGTASPFGVGAPGESTLTEAPGADRPHAVVVPGVRLALAVVCT